MPVRFFSENISLKVKNKALIKTWIINASRDFGRKVENINYVFVSKDEILSLNTEFLNHKYYTDIISFDYSAQSGLSGDIYIAPDIVMENAKNYHTIFNEELKRVLIHGILHLLGFRDKSKEEASEMRKMEDKYLSIVKDLIII